MSAFDPDTSREVLSIDPRFASIKVTPNSASEGAEKNFPRNLHNAAELFLKLGVVDRCVRLSVCTKKLFKCLEQGPDGKSSLALGCAAVCWSCGHVGLPRNAEECDRAGRGGGKRPVCKQCGEDDDANFVRVLQTDGTEVPWMEMKPKPVGEDGSPMPDIAAADTSAPSASPPIPAPAPAPAPSASSHVRKPGVSTPSTLSSFVSSAGPHLIVVDVRTSDFGLEPGDAVTCRSAPLPGGASRGEKAEEEEEGRDAAGEARRPRAVNAPFDRKKGVLDESLIPSEWVERAGGKELVPIITHCGGGGRGQKAKEYLEAKGFKNVVNGGGPEDEECWAVFGDK